MEIGAAPPLQKSHRNHVLVCEQKPYAVWFSCRRMRSYRQPISFPGAYTISCGERNAKKKVLSTTYHTISAVCSCSALWDPLPCSSPSTPDCLGAPFGRGTFPGGQVRFLGDFGVLVYPPSGVARQSHCTPALLSILMSLGHCTDHCSTRSGSRAPEKKKKKTISIS